jgi:hypothetical protein
LGSSGGTATRHEQQQRSHASGSRARHYSERWRAREFALAHGDVDGILEPDVAWPEVDDGDNKYDDNSGLATGE